ncbi:fungal-specific transcription factor domain-domain-containing protein [Leucosporidium creatinivorum]|uniref:Fungal-specific transcription factor domain-domain-containing protein n=1 Tax=Leucosporidium creatinivorum TaxID=106004 RepID=A0A1Y2CN03_9BASI|nr:fungal-specific transcription factor domain-domain-containing protein [Leucosporidium creatinivorum]
MSVSSASSTYTVSPPKHPSPPEDKPTKLPISARACDACRRRKTRCSNKTGDGSETCTYCAGIGKPCTYEPIKRGPPKTYVESLENRMEAMEELLRNLSASSGIDLVAMMATNESSTDSERTEALERVAESLSQQRQAVGQETPSVPRPPPPPPVTQEPPMREPELEVIDKLRYFGRSSGPYLAHGVLDDYAKDAAIPMDMSNSLVEDLIEREHQAAGKHFAFPPMDLTRTLIDAYFARFNAHTPLLHRPSFERALGAGMADTNPSFRSLVLMMLAIGAVFVLRRFDGTTLTDHHHHPSSLFDIQASVLGVVWLLGAMTPMATWTASGHALRKAIDVGVHRENRSRWTFSVLEDQLRKRAFWILYSLDRNISACMGRPVAMADEDTDLAYPLDIDDAALDDWNLRGSKSAPPPLAQSTVSVIATLARAEKIHGQILKRIYGMRAPQTSTEACTIVSELDSSLNDWLNGVPAHLRWNVDKLDPSFMIASASVFAVYYHAQILVHREFLSPMRARLVPFPSLAICNNGARAMAHILDALRTRGKIKETFFWSPFSGGTSALILLITLLSQTATTGASITESAAGDLFKCMKVVQDLADTSCMAAKCLNGIQKLTALADIAPGMRPTKLAERLGIDKSTLKWKGPFIPTSDTFSVPTPPSSGLNLPLTTDDLSLRTFNGDPTFSLFDFDSAGSSFAPPLNEKAASSPSDFSWDVYQNFTWPQLDDVELVDDMAETGWLQAQQAQQAQSKQEF